MEYRIRQMMEYEYPMLDELLYEAIFQRERESPVPRDIIQKPELQLYVKDFGREKADFCFCAEKDGKIIGAVWVRDIKGYGSLGNVSLELAISLYKEYRGNSIGTELMKKMLNYLKRNGYSKLSLAV